MRLRTRLTSPMLVAIAALTFTAPAAHAAFGALTFEAGTCKTAEPSCTYASPHSDFYTQAAGHPAWGITKFEMKQSGGQPEGASVKRIRVDVPPGLAANPEAPKPKCSIAQFQAEPAGCPTSSIVGSTNMAAVAFPLEGIGLGSPIPLPELSGTVYNLDGAPAGLPLDFGIAVEPAGKLISPIRLLLEGHVDWSGDYHEFFEIDNVPKEAKVNVLGEIVAVNASLKVQMSKLNFNGHAGGNFLTLPSVCSSTTTSFLELESWSGEHFNGKTETPVGVTGCENVTFTSSVTVAPATAQSDAPDGAVTVVQVPQKVQENEINTADVQDAHVTLPPGLTINPSAAHGLDGCTPSQIGIGTTNPVACPAAAQIGEVAIETDLPPGSLKGRVFLGKPASALITGPPYTIYLDAESSLGVSVRLQGSVAPNSETGQLEITFTHNPPLPFGELRLTLNGGEHAPLANPLVCGTGATGFLFTPYTGGPAAFGSTPFETSGCASPLPFAPSQGTSDSPTNGGAFGSTSFTFNLSRPQGQQYLGKLTTALPAGLVGAVPKVTRCAEAEAQAGTCGAQSQIGTANASVGSGDPYSFSGPVYFTGPYAGAPFGLSIPIHAAAGPFDLGTIVTRVGIGVDQHSGRVIASTVLPTIFKGVPLRLRNLSVTVNHSEFLYNPTDCGNLETNSTATSTFGAVSGVSSPFQVFNCGALQFKPAFSAATSASTNPAQLKADGASLKVNLVQGAHQANIHSVVASLPKALPSRLTTLQKACPEVTYAANPFSCPSGSKVGSATVSTPVLPDELKGPAYLVSHGGEAFPDLDLLLEGDGVRVILEGNTNIKNGITTSTFASVPDVPVSKFVLELPSGPNSALTAIGALCTQSLVMPTTITAHSGTVIKQNTPIGVAGCAGGKGHTRIKILSWRVMHHKLLLRIQTFAAGRVSVKSNNLRTVFRRVSKPSKITIEVPLSRGGSRALSRHRPLMFKVRVGFLPKLKSESVSVATTRVKFKH